MQWNDKRKFKRHDRHGITFVVALPQKSQAVICYSYRKEHNMKLEMISKYPLKSAHPIPLLFIHGTLHTASCWDVYFLDYFAQHGYAAYAVNLRGHGKSEGREKLRWTRIADFVEDVANVVQQLPSPPILIGHSMGGFIIQKYLEDHDAPAAVLLSSASPAGLLPTAIRTARRQPWVFAKVNLTLSLKPFIATPQLVG